ncbi:hypothetical protein Y032_0076g1066 [Ancylostoma ceylanicum]|uniref:Uncharacterized protein n=1 Tax=Ancylostoma ceylanicum TaxID=53326 RepID=A0A016TVP5_9BILA|nr:hypothetical protein Y032_0076g1066 [Ancylostoma ceylanicum]
MLRLHGLSDLCRYEAMSKIEEASTHRPTPPPQVLPPQLQVKARLSEVHLLSWSRTNKRRVRTTTIFGCMKITYCYCYWCY